MEEEEEDGDDDECIYKLIGGDDRQRGILPT